MWRALSPGTRPNPVVCNDCSVCIVTFSLLFKRRYGRLIYGFYLLIFIFNNRVVTFIGVNTELTFIIYKLGFFVIIFLLFFFFTRLKLFYRL